MRQGKRGVLECLLVGVFLTGKWNGLQLALGFVGYVETCDVHETIEHAFENDAGVLNSGLYLKYNFGDKSSIKGYCFNTGEIANDLDPLYSKGLLLDSKRLESTDLAYCC